MKTYLKIFGLFYLTLLKINDDASMRENIIKFDWEFEPFDLENKSIYMSVKYMDQSDYFTIMATKAAFQYKDFKLHRFSDDECYVTIAKFYKKYLPTFVNLPFGVMKSDFCRYLMIYHNGGIYIDSDVVIKKNPAYWIPSTIKTKIREEKINVFIGVEAYLPNDYTKYKFYHPYQISQWTFAANKNHKIFLDCLDDIHNAFEGNKTKFEDIHNIIELTGPGAFTRSVHQFIAPFVKDSSELANAPMIVKDVYIGPPNTLNCGIEQKYEGKLYYCNKYSVSEHLYSGSWKGKTRNLE